METDNLYFKPDSLIEHVSRVLWSLTTNVYYEIVSNFQ